VLKFPKEMSSLIRRKIFKIEKQLGAAGGKEKELETRLKLKQDRKKLQSKF
jgi:hypothetical protein